MLSHQQSLISGWLLGGRTFLPVRIAAGRATIPSISLKTAHKRRYVLSFGVAIT